MNRTTKITTAFVCVIQPISEWVLAIVMVNAMVNVVQMDMTGGSRLGEHPFSLVKGYIIILLKTILLC